MSKAAKDIAKSIKAAASDKTKGYDTQAEVVRVDGDTAYVHIPGGVDETPTKMNISAEVGDKVQVRVAGGKAWITGNTSRPPTDDRTAKQAQNTARGASVAVSRIETRVDDAIRPDGTLIAEQVKGFIDGSLAQLRAQSSEAQKEDVRAIIFEDTDPASPSYGALAIGTVGLQISNKRNAENTDWIWSTFGTGSGFNADLINAGSINADLITSGEINADLITTGEMEGDRIHGGVITVGGNGNANGKISVLDASGKTVVNIDRSGVTLSNGASIISANGVCGNLQFLSGGGNASIFGYVDRGTITTAQKLYLAAYIPDNYVITSATMVLKLAPAKWSSYTGTTYTGYARNIALKYGTDAAMTYEGEIMSDVILPASAAFKAVPTAIIGEMTGSGSATSVVTKTSGDLKSLLTAGSTTIFEISSYVPTSGVPDDSWYQYTGAALAVLNVIGYTRT